MLGTQHLHPNLHILWILLPIKKKSYNQKLAEICNWLFFFKNKILKVSKKQK